MRRSRGNGGWQAAAAVMLAAVDLARRFAGTRGRGPRMTDRSTRDGLLTRPVSWAVATSVVAVGCALIWPRAVDTLLRLLPAVLAIGFLLVIGSRAVRRLPRSGGNSPFHMERGRRSTTEDRRDCGDWSRVSKRPSVPRLPR